MNRDSKKVTPGQSFLFQFSMMCGALFFLFFIMAESSNKRFSDCVVLKENVEITQPLEDPYNGDRVKIKIRFGVLDHRSAVYRRHVYDGRRFIRTNISRRTSIMDYGEEICIESPPVNITTPADAAVDFFKVNTTHPCLIAPVFRMYHLDGFRVEKIDSTTMFWLMLSYMILSVIFGFLMYFAMKGCMGLGSDEGEVYTELEKVRHDP